MSFMENFNSPELLKKILNKTSGNVYWRSLDGRLMGCNDNVARFFNFKVSDEIVGKTTKDLAGSTEEARRIEEQDRIVYSTRSAVEEEEVVTLKDGSQCIYLTRREPLFDDAGNLIGLMGVSTDITDQKLREKLEIEQESLKKANEMMRFWAGAIAHEIRTPLMSIAMMADTLDFFLSNLKQDYPELWKAPYVRIVVASSDGKNYKGANQRRQ